jgi:hypothetical protein
VYIISTIFLEIKSDNQIIFSIVKIYYGQTNNGCGPICGH